MEDAKQQEQMQKYMQMQQIDQQIKQSQKQILMLDEQLQDLNITEQALKDVQNTKPGTEILAPVSNGIFIQSELKDNKDVRINIEAGVIVKKSIQDAKKFISYRADKVDPNRNQKYTLCILRTYIKGGIGKYEDFGRVLEYLTIFDKHKKKMTIKDINQIKTLSDLGEISLPFADEEEPSRKQRKKSQEQNFYDSGEAELIFNSNRLKIFIPKTVEASCYL